MPVFDYKCGSCGAREEHIVLQGEEPPTVCGSCGGSLRKTFGVGRLLVNLEGWGFSKTDGLIADTRGKDFKALKERAQRIVEE
ncbi:MAG TPA: zinc ribbon domain-containing protein [Actinomycetota bacterium]